MLTRLAKFTLGLLAYSPLFMILLIKNRPLVQGIIEGVIAFLIIVFFSWIIIRSIEGISGEDIKVKIDRDINDQYVVFIVTYITPFIGTIKTLNDLIATGILIIVIFSLYISTSLFAINPLLKLIFGYNLYLCTINNKDGILLSKENLNRNEELRLAAYCIDESSNLFIHTKKEVKPK